MGSVFNKVMKKITAPKQEIKVLMDGLHDSGKTTILYQLKLKDTIQTIPTIGSNVETIEYKNISFLIWDVSYRGKYHHGGVSRTAQHYNFDAIIFVVDSNDTKLLADDVCFSQVTDNAKNELDVWMKGDKLNGIPLLIYANKKDLSKGGNIDIVKEKLQLTDIQDRQWNIIATNGTTGDGLYDGLDWLIQVLNERE
eukprot:133963_1